MTSVLIRRSVIRKDGERTYNDLEIDDVEISIGATADNTLQLDGAGVAPEHAILRITKGVSKIKALGANTLLVNNVVARKAKLKAGDQIGIGTRAINVVAPPAGFDLALAIEPIDHDKETRVDLLYATSVQEIGLRKRRPAWLLAIGILVLFLILPLVLSRLDLRGGGGIPFVVTDAFWSSGDLHPSHRLSTEDNCLDCHQVLFSMVKNEACLDCHQFTLDHVQVVDATAHGLESERCGSCHREHNEPPMLIDARSALCIDCHESPGGIEREADPLASVVGFNANDHPNFEVTLPAMHAEDSGPVSWSWSHLPVAGAKENSNLKFPHDVHLDPEQVTRLTNGDPLACLDCHQLSTDKEHFIPVMMETHCESCHELKFDDANPFRRLPHGDASEAIRMMEGHFLKKALSITGDAGPAVKWRRIPDRPPRGEVCNESKGECAEEAFLKEVEEQFLRTGCVSCHEVETLDTDYVVERYRVVPVLLPTDFFPTQFFDHASHLIMEDMIGDAACSSCHSAIDSSESSDLLIPDAKDCYSCHGDENTESLVQMNCVNCHAYHPSSLSSNVDIFK